MAQIDPPKSPLAVYRDNGAKGELAYQVCRDDGSVLSSQCTVILGAGATL
ncbi:MAG: hypothetical protein CFH40_01558 [Alphaproteobacteria bacterium MarineAlpha10_Bin3]|jgi:hypothetical protein|nr:MAG: hypothetical protein CFH40_01558 [Alphaproteobacteria bacterium MarineAlpha10_Bin3]PPR70425.1 MAG: hypothetical protein CFH09_01558 [Alphaproteobacteria bacterium MarineAlpha4_Bin1]